MPSALNTGSTFLHEDKMPFIMSVEVPWFDFPCSRDRTIYKSFFQAFYKVLIRRIYNMSNQLPSSFDGTDRYDEEYVKQTIAFQESFVADY